MDDRAWVHVSRYNEAPDYFTNVAAEKFIDDVLKDVESGIGFVPFVGAGFSVAAGAPLTWDLERYLRKCIFLALRPDGGTPWEPRKHRWPHFAETTYGFNDGIDKVNERHIAGGLSESLQRLYQEALGAAADWRSALLFLSRITRDSDGPFLDAPRQEVIDACLRTAMSGRSPSISHKMLATLAGVLRMETILTTNFDDLLERAFADARNPLETYSVPLKSDLPNIALTSGTRTLIKLHGTGHGLRADYSLDETPPEADRETFVDYLAAPQRLNDDGERIGEGLKRTARNHLLMLGVSGRERRIQGFLRHAWRRIPDLVVYWVCFSSKDVEHIESLVARIAKVPPGVGPVPSPDAGRCEILQYKHIGLLLLQMYQRARRALPAVGCPFPSISRIPTPPLHRPIRKDDGGKIPLPDEKFLAAVNGMQMSTYSKRRLLVAVDKTPGQSGMTTAVAAVFWQLYDQYTSIWIDMNDVSDVDNLYETLLETFLYRVGVEHWTPVFDERDDDLRTQELERVARFTGKRWIVFLNARETPGANLTPPLAAGGSAVDADRKKTTTGNGWLDRDDKDAHRLVEFLSALTKSNAPRPAPDNKPTPPAPGDRPVSVVLLLRGTPDSPSPIAGGLRCAKEELFPVEPQETETTAANASNALSFAKEQPPGAWAPLGSKEQKPNELFLRYLVHSQRPRLDAIRWSNPNLGEFGRFSHDKVPIAEEGAYPINKFIEAVCGMKHGVLRHKPGGFIWLHCLTRQELRRELNDRACDAKIHESLAIWYRQVLDASNAPAAVFESVYHYCTAAILRYPGSQRDAIGYIREATTLLRDHAPLIQTQSYSRGSCRKLESTRLLYQDWTNREMIGDKDFALAWCELALVCTDIMRAVAREVGEAEKAYQRQSESRALLRANVEDESFANLVKDWSPRQDNAGRHLSSGENQTAGEMPEEAETTNLYEALAVVASKGDALRPAQRWMRWLRWCGMLGNMSRAYEVAIDMINRCLRFAAEGKDRSLAFAGVEGGKDRPFDIRDFNVSAIDEVDFFEVKPDSEKSAAEKKLRSLQKIRLEVLRALEQFVEVRLYRATLLERLMALRDAPDEERAKDARRLRGEATKGIDKARELTRQIFSNDWTSLSNSATVQAVWSKTRLLLHEAGLALRSPDRTDTKEALRLLSEAEASQRMAPQRFVSELATIEIRRADAKIVEAECVRSTDGNLTFKEVCERALRKDVLEKKTEENLQAFSDQDRRKIERHLSDAMRYLDRAEPILRERRRNVWWTTLLFERRIYIMSLHLWATFGDGSGVIPFLGIEDSPDGLKTPPERLLDDAIRMVRIDSLRLAYIVTSFASCVRAFRARRATLPKGTAWYDGRESKLRDALGRALGRLEEVHKKRGQLTSHWPQDEEVNDFVAEVLAMADRRQVTRPDARQVAVTPPRRETFDGSARKSPSLNVSRPFPGSLPG